MVTDDIDHEGAFWGIGFPVRALPFDQSAVDIIEKYLEGSGPPAESARFQRFNLAVVFLSIIVKRNWKFIEHKIVV